MSVGSFYNLFKNKVDLAATLYVETQQQLFQALFEEVTNYKDAPAHDGIAAVVRSYLLWAAQHPTEMTYLAYRHQLEIGEDELEKAAETEFYALLGNWLQTQIDRGQIRTLPTEHYFALWFGPTEYLIRKALDTYGAFYKPSEPQLKEHLLSSADLLAESAWQLMRPWPVGTAG
jgi:AcrR family transcriptional regulator